jgi:hypothetical protein
MKETKHERFIRVAEKRVNKIISLMNLLGNCSDKSNYNYTDGDVEIIFDRLEKELEMARNRFRHSKRKEEFKIKC